jgi:hypothetical protein
MWPNFCSTYFTYSSMFENCFRSILYIHIYKISLKSVTILITAYRIFKNILFRQLITKLDYPLTCYASKQEGMDKIELKDVVKYVILLILKMTSILILCVQSIDGSGMLHRQLLLACSNFLN